MRALSYIETMRVGASPPPVNFEYTIYLVYYYMKRIHFICLYILITQVDFEKNRKLLRITLCSVPNDYYIPSEYTYVL